MKLAKIVKNIKENIKKSAFHFIKLLVTILPVALILYSCAKDDTSEPVVTPDPPVTTAKKPNILMILTDDQGYGDVSYAGFASDLKTPNIDSLAAAGMHFSNFYANSTVCSPTRAALMTGRFPGLVGIQGTVARNPDSNMGNFTPTGPTLPELVKSVGYNTAMVGKWHLGDHKGKDPTIPTRKGFDFFQGFVGAAADYYTHEGKSYGWPGDNLMMKNETVLDPEPLDKIHTTDLFTQWTKEYLDTQKDETNPFMLYLAYSAPHDPLQPPKAWLDKVQAREPGISADRAKLVALIEHMDDSIGQIIQKLKDLGKYENTLILFSSDNGGYRKFSANVGPYKGGKLDFYEGGIRVPMFAVWPGKIAPDTSSTEVSLTMDLYATMAEAAGATITHEIEGQSILPVLLGESGQRAPRNLIFENRSTLEDSKWKTIHAVRSQDWKLLQDKPGGTFELYNLADDPYEIENLISTHPDKADELMAILNDYLAKEKQIAWQPQLDLEHGKAAGVSDEWQTITLEKNYRAPVVVATPIYATNTPPVVTRIRGIADLAKDHSSFELKLDRADGLSEALTPIEVNYVVFEAGIYNQLNHGINLEAMRFDSKTTDYTSQWKGELRPLLNSYTQPVVVGQVLSYKDSNFSTFWSRGTSFDSPPTANTLFVGKHVGEDPNITRTAETIGYIVSESGVNTFSDKAFISGLSPVAINGVGDAPPYIVSHTGLNEAVVAVTSQAGMRGNNGSWAVLYGPNALSSTQLNVAIDEDKITDTERKHENAEQVGYLIFGTAAN